MYRKPHKKFFKNKCELINNTCLYRTLIQGGTLLSFCRQPINLTSKISNFLHTFLSSTITRLFHVFGLSCSFIGIIFFIKAWYYLKFVLVTIHNSNKTLAPLNGVSKTQSFIKNITHCNGTNSCVRIHSIYHLCITDQPFFLMNYF